MNLSLALDTSGKTFYISLLEHSNNNVEVICKSEINSRDDSKDIFPEFINTFLGEAQTKLNKIAAFFLGVGPGSFTGLRIGAGYLTGIAFALKKPIYGIPSFVAMANQALTNLKTDHQEEFSDYCVIRPAGRGELFYQILSSTNKNLSMLLPAIATATEINNIFLKNHDTSKKAIIYRQDEELEISDELKTVKFVVLQNFSGALIKPNIFFSDDICKNKESKKIDLIYTREVVAKTIAERRKTGVTI